LKPLLENFYFHPTSDIMEIRHDTSGGLAALRRDEEDLTEMEKALKRGG
jgi:hypothetical protein